MSGFWNIAAQKKRTFRDLGLAAVFVLLFGLILEVFCSLPSLRAAGDGPQTVPFSQIEADGFVQEDGGLRLEGEEGYLHIPLSGAYVGNFVYSYDYDGLLNVVIRAGVENVYGEFRERDAKIIQDRNSRVVKTSWVPIGEKAAYVDLYVNRSSLREAGLSYIDFDSMPLVFTSFGTETAAGLNGRRLCFFWCLGILLVGLTAFRSAFAGRIETGFLILALTVGTLFSLSLPANKVSWDEEVHFSQAFWLANYRNPVPVSPAILQEFMAGIDTWPYNQPGSREEQAALDDYLDREGNYRTGEHLWSIDLNKTTMTGYAGQALFIKAGELAGLPFSDVFRLGRLGNLWVYCLVLFFAIRITPVGKGILAFLGLMPEPMMLAGVYSYDPTVTAFLYLTFALLLRAILDEKRKMTWREFALILFCFFWGCRVKAVYAPLLLLGLLIPRERFRSEREQLLMKGGFGLAAGLIILSFALPFLMAPSEAGDVRGENTSERGQLAYILGQPLAYAEILLKNMFRSLPSYVLGEGSLGLLGHQGQVSFPWILYAGSTAVILTDGYSACGRRLNRWQRLAILFLCGAAAVLVWTSMYLVFTTPGNTFIDGVQGRYYLPFLFLLWLILNPPRLAVRLRERDYNGLVLALSGGTLLACYYLDILPKFCL